MLPWVQPPCHSPSLVQRAQSVPPHPACQARRLVGSTPLRSLSVCYSITQLSANFTSTSANAIGRSFRGHGCGFCCPGSGFLGPQSSGAIVAEVHSFAVQCGTIPRVQVPIRSRNTTGPPLPSSQTVRWPQCQHCANHWALARPPAQPLWPFVSPASLLGRREFRSSLLDRCTLHFDPRNLVFMLYQQQPSSVP